MESRVYGYARVSSSGQNVARQIAALHKYGIPDECIIADKKSGKDIDRTGYLYLRNNLLRHGDTLVVTELDRLSRNKADIKSELEYYITNGIRVQILNIPTTLIAPVEGQEWVLELVNNILVEVLGSIAQAEREKIHQRQREGIAAAKKQGKHLGRPEIRVPDRWAETLRQVESGQMKAVDAMRKLELKKSTYYLLRQKYPLTEN